MSVRIVELFGFSPADTSALAVESRNNEQCPFIRDKCTKTLNDGIVSGVCTIKQVNSGPIVCCPNRLYSNDHQILLDIAQEAFGEDIRLIPGQKSAGIAHDGKNVAVFGKRWGKELHLPQRAGTGSYFVDWILALISPSGTLQEFVAVEVQAIDTTGNYRKEREAYMKGELFSGFSTAGVNWENVSKRILPQLIYKGHVLRRERLCAKGLFFVCPAPVRDKIVQRLGGTLLGYGLQPGALTFRWYDLGPEIENGLQRDLVLGGQMTTTVDQVATAFTAPTNLPEAGVYQQAIQSELLRGH
ncbi:MAG: NotI family restriction endonuclease [Acidobacteriaceae bacterium]